MGNGATWYLVALAALLVALLWRRQIALAVVVICATYGLAQDQLSVLRMPDAVERGIADRQAVAQERARRFACERRAVAALSRDDGRALAKVHRDCGGVFSSDLGVPGD